MQNYSALLTPAIPFPAIAVADVDEQKTPMASFARAGNYLTTCGLALPAGLNNDGLPLSVQLLGKAFSEAELLRIGVAFQHVTNWHRAKPDLTGLGL
jgi:aspartyl-tRNA(Asn)/glutamyl-tRNA(Gln) amidotransferase subunit A